MPKKSEKEQKPATGASKNVLNAIQASAEDIHSKIMARKKPTMKLPVRSLSNVRYQPQRGFFEMTGQKKERTLTVNTVKTFAQTLRMVALSKELVENDDIATKREAYYVSKNWEDARFTEQPESDTVMDDVEAYFGVNREQLGFIPEEKGGDVAGRLVVIDHDRDTGQVLRIDCTKFGSGAYSIPISVEQLQFETKRRFHPRDRDRGHVSTAGKTQLLEKGQLHPGQHGRRSDPRLPPLHPPAGRFQKDPGLCFCRRRSVRNHQHLPNAESRLRKCRAPERVLLRPAGAGFWESRRRTSSTTSCRLIR